MRFEVFMAMTIQIVVFGVVTPCGVTITSLHDVSNQKTATCIWYNAD